MARNKVVAMILAGGAGTRLDILTQTRTKPAVPFAGKYRIIDFTLSNCKNSEISDISLLTQYYPHSLIKHVITGKEWELDKNRSINILSPYQQINNIWYSGTANAIYQNLEYIYKVMPKYVLVLAGDHIYSMDYSKLIDYHESKNADITIAMKQMDISKIEKFGVVETNDDNLVIGFEEKPERPKSDFASMGIYLFSCDVLVKALLAYCGPKGLSDFGRDIIPILINSEKIYGYEFSGYWKDVGTLEEYMTTNLEFTKEDMPIDLHDEKHKIYTKNSDLPPVRFFENSIVSNCLISDGCVIKGFVKNSVISHGVTIEEGAVVENSVIFRGTYIGKNTKIRDTVIDKNTIIGQNCIIGTGSKLIVNYETPAKVNNGMNIIGKNVNIPDNITIERNCRIYSNVSGKSFKLTKITSGISIHPCEEENVYIAMYKNKK